MLLQLFYRALNQHKKAIKDNISDGSFINSSCGIVSKILDQVAIWCKGWDIKDFEVAMGSPSLYILCNDRKEQKEETESKMSKAMSYLKLRLDHMLGYFMESVNVIDVIEVKTCKEKE